MASALFLSTCNNKEKVEQQNKRSRQMVLDSVHEANRRQSVIDSLTAVASASPDALVIESPALFPTPSVQKNAKRPPVKTQPAIPVNTGFDSKTPSNSTVASGEGAAAGTGTMSEGQKKKKGLNNAVKGAIIGLGTGAAAGVVLNKDNRGKGAVIGGVVGAVGGAVGGAVLDKRKAKKDTANKKEK